MKKLLTLAVFAGMFSFVACGPSQAELDKKKKMHDDSVRMADSTAAAEEAAKMKEQNTQDSIKKVEREKMMADSLHKDSVDKKLKPAKKK